MIDSILFLAVPLPPEPPPGGCLFLPSKGSGKVEGSFGGHAFAQIPKNRDLGRVERSREGHVSASSSSVGKSFDGHVLTLCPLFWGFK
jgi:hypothetical protein